ncbi:uncharacterized protein LOC130777259 [Actinidia eriantha]|uniref:uncharacterized protein LOC130777259 n=1 Tax=Actinidia eriantha TaxID=165200 RepID=UPI00258BAC67|nr:uncharacterized protein LOC130777259 [Actinidia eriantha]
MRNQSWRLLLIRCHSRSQQHHIPGRFSHFHSHPTQVVIRKAKTQLVHWSNCIADISLSYRAHTLTQALKMAIGSSKHRYFTCRGLTENDTTRTPFVCSAWLSSLSIN